MRKHGLHTAQIETHKWQHINFVKASLKEA